MGLPEIDEKQAEFIIATLMKAHHEATLETIRLRAALREAREKLRRADNRRN